MAYNYSKLLGKITEKFGTQGNFAKSMNISERSLSLKLTNKVPFKQLIAAHGNSIRALRKHLEGISDKEIPAHFFTLEVQ